MDDEKKERKHYPRRLKPATAYTTAEELQVWREAAAKDGRTLSGLIAMLLRTYCLDEHDIDSMKPQKRKK